MRRAKNISVCSMAVLLTVFFASSARADDIDKKEDGQEGAKFLHVPMASARPGTKVAITGTPSHLLNIERMVLAYRRGGETKWSEAQFKRSVKKTSVAVIPKETVESPGVDYYIYFAPKNKGEEPIDLFASKEKPYRIQVHGYSKRTRYEKRKAEWEGRLSRVEANYGYTDFGNNLAMDENGEEYSTDAGNFYHEVNLAYTYRFLNYLYALRVEIGGFAHDFADFRPFTASPDEEIGAGMYDISPSVEFEFAKYFGASILMRLGISEDGFEGGAGTSVRIGRIKGTRLDLGFEGMSHAGWRMFLKFEWDTVPFVPMSFNMDRTQWYAASTYNPADNINGWGSRLFYEAKFLLPKGIGLKGHIGFASRDEAVKSGFTGGGGAYLDF